MLTEPVGADGAVVQGDRGRPARRAGRGGGMAVAKAGARAVARAGASVGASAVAIAVGLGLAGSGGTSVAAACLAQSGATAPTLVELYTSEGCSSCPPADRWLSALNRDDVLAMAFHVTYWDRLGWTDRYAQAAFTERQRATMTSNGARQVYTPQVVVDGRDAPEWRLPKTAGAAAFDLQLTREGDMVTARIERRAGGSAAVSQLAGYWVLLEDGHHSDVRAGENAGATLRHDHVVRQLQPVAAWSSGHEQRLKWQPARIAEVAGTAGVKRRVAFVVVDAATQRPLQALALAC